MTEELKPYTAPDEAQDMARAICRERCAFYGEPPCYERVDDTDPEWPNPHCDTHRDGDCCQSLAHVAYDARPRTQWRTDVENAPRDGTPFLACVEIDEDDYHFDETGPKGGHHAAVIWWDADRDAWRYCSFDCGHYGYLLDREPQPTAWVPLPSLPSTEEDG